MIIRILIITLIVSACGREVKLKPNKLESTQQITNADIVKYQKMGTFVKDTNSVVISGASYKVSIYSSKDALEFIASIPAGSKIPVLVVGGYGANEIVIESIVRQ